MELTEEQKKKLKALQRSSAKRGLWSAIKAFLLLIPTNALVIFLDVFVVHSQTFSFIGSFVNGFFIFSYLGRNIRKEHDRIKLEVKNILEQ